MTPAAAERNRARILMAFAAVYLIWGSTYLGIKFAIETIPPFVMSGLRFLIAGGILYAFARWRGAPKPTASDVRTSAITGVLMVTFGNGAVVWSEQTVPSGIAALIVSLVPIWMVLIDWLRPRGVRPRLPVFVGLGLGIVGIVFLIGPSAIVGRGHVPAAGAFVLLLGGLSWAFGSIITRGGARPRSALLTTALQMSAGGVAFMVMAATLGELRDFSFSAIAAPSLVALLYLIFFGALVAYTAYVYLLGNVSAAKASTYAYVNPVVAVILGWAVAREPIGPRTVIAAAIILAGVAIITRMHTAAAHSTDEHPLPTESPERARSAA